MQPTSDQHEPERSGQATTSSAAKGRVSAGVWVPGSLGVFALAAGAAFWRYTPWMPNTFLGDDLANLMWFRAGVFASNLPQAVFGGFTEKFRPVFQTGCWLLFGLFGDRISAFLTFNLLLHALSASVLFAVAYRVSRGNWLVGLAVALAFATSRFALYQVTQVTGLVEGLALLAFLAMLYAAVRASESCAAGRWPWLAALAAFLTVHAHERYLLIIAWLAAMSIIWARAARWSRGRMAAALGVCAGLLAFNLLYKRVVLHLPILVGTGGTHIDLDLRRAVDQLGQAVLSLVGVNEGPPYLIGVRLTALRDPLAWTAAGVLCLALPATIALGVRRARKLEQASPTHLPIDSPWAPASLLVLGALLLVPPLATIRLEQRWLLAPFVLLLLGVAWASRGRSPGARLRSCLPSVIIAVASVVLDTQLAPFFPNIFFVGAGQAAAAFKRDLVDRGTRYPGPLVVLASPGACGMLVGEEFFKLYRPAATSAQCFVAGNADWVPEVAGDATVLLYDDQGRTFQDVTAIWRGVKSRQADRVVLDFLGAFPSGHLAERRAFVGSFETPLGKRPSLLAVPRLTWQFEAVRVGPQDSLRFGVAMLDATPPSARAIVKAIDESSSQPEVIYTQELPPAAPGRPPEMREVSVPLERFAGRKIAFAFSMETAEDHGQRVGYATPRIVRDGEPAANQPAAKALATLFVETAGLGPPVWRVPALAGAWVDYGNGFAGAGYLKDELGVVHLEGVVRGGAGAIFTLPVGFRPREHQNFAITASDAFGEVQVLSNGLVVLAAGSSAVGISLNGITFRAER